MEIVINVPEEDYEYLKSHNEGGLYNAVIHGTPLPNGHGRLIDADELYDSLIFPTEQFANGFKEVLDDAPTVIEASEDK